jgi:hypothetical protein
MMQWLTRRSGNTFPPPPKTNSERFEQKFYLPASTIPFAAHLLTHCCPEDRQYPRGTIHSIYFDTPDLDYFSDSQEGNHGRVKVRVRWYDSPPAGSESTTVFLEVKSKRGYAGSKKRKSFLTPSERLGDSGLNQGVLPFPAVMHGLAELGYCPPNLLQPLILISYRRLRFVERMTGSRVSLDWDIRSTLIDPKAGRREGSIRMEGGVIEVKGQSSEIPTTLQSIRNLGTDWSRYSKYASCVEAHLEEPGSVGRVWPSGRTEPE